MGQILQALSKKLVLDDGVMLDQIAAETEGFSGADLQAVMYNAHLEVVQASIADMSIGDSLPKADKGKGKANGKGKGKAAVNGDHDTRSAQAKDNFRQISPEEAMDRQSRLDMTQRVRALLQPMEVNR